MDVTNNYKVDKPEHLDILVYDLNNSGSSRKTPRPLLPDVPHMDDMGYMTVIMN